MKYKKKNHIFTLLSQGIHLDDIWFILMGIFVFSSLSSTILIKTLKFPMSMPELLLLPFFFVVRKKMNSIKIKVNDVFLVSFVCGILVLIGLLYGTFSLLSILSSTRSWFYLFLMLIAFSRYNRINSHDIFCLALGCIIGWTIDSLLNYDRLVQSVIYKKFLVTYGVYMAIPVFFSLTVYRKKYLLLFIGLLLMVIISIYSGIRRPLAIFVLSLFLSFFFTLKRTGKSVFSYLLVAVVFVSIVVAFLPSIRNTIQESSTGLYNRTFLRTEEMLMDMELNSSDQGRQNTIISISENFMDYTLPRGMVSVRTSEDESVGVFNDFPLYQLWWIFSWPIVLVFVFYLSYIFIHNYRKYSKYQDETSLLSISCFLIICVLLFLDGTFIEFAYATPITGMLLGRAILNAKTKNIIA